MHDSLKKTHVQQPSTPSKASKAGHQLIFDTAIYV
jgi:hypothetical protein